MRAGAVGLGLPPNNVGCGVPGALYAVSEASGPFFGLLDGGASVYSLEGAAAATAAGAGVAVPRLPVAVGCTHFGAKLPFQAPVGSAAGAAASDGGCGGQAVLTPAGGCRTTGIRLGNPPACTDTCSIPSKSPPLIPDRSPPPPPAAEAADAAIAAAAASCAARRTSCISRTTSSI